MPEGFTLYQNRGVMGAGVICAELEMAGDAASGFRGNEIGGVGVDLEEHIVGNKPEVAPRVSCCVVEEAITGG